MGIKYEFDQSLQNEVEDISKSLFPHVKLDRIKCFRSYGSSSRNTIARCHALGKLLQMAIGVKGWYAIEFINENFEKLSDDEKTKVMIHELMHIPKTFGGGFRHHDYVCDRNIDKFHKQYKYMKQGNIQNGDRKLKDFFKW
jgi:predicted metallopeptidase